MATTSPKQRLGKLFKRRDHSVPHGESPSPSSSPTSPATQAATTAGDARSPRRSNSRRSLREMVNKKGRNSIDSSSSPAAQAAATAALYSQNRDLPDVPHQSDLSSDLGHLTLNGAGSANGDLGSSPSVKRKPLNSETDSYGAQQAAAHAARGSQPLAAERSQPTDAGIRNITQHGRPSGTDPNYSSPLQSHNGTTRDVGSESTRSPATKLSGHSLSRKPDVNDLRGNSPDAEHDGAGLLGISRSSLEKPLPNTPGTGAGASIDRGNAKGIESELGRERGYLVRDAAQPVDLAGIVDLKNSEDVTLHESWARAVTHETVIPDVHEIREEQITREIHTHDVHHRVLPIIDIEVLPARHFVPVQGGYAEVAEEELPGRTGKNAQWVIAELASKGLPKGQSPAPRDFTARKFENGDGDYQERRAPEGHWQTKTTWVHPPELETLGQASGQTHAFHFGSSDPRDDGLRAKLPVGNLIGTSPAIAQRNREHQSKKEATLANGSSDHAPPVPEHKQMPSRMHHSGL